MGGKRNGSCIQLDTANPSVRVLISILFDIDFGNVERVEFVSSEVERPGELVGPTCMASFTSLVNCSYGMDIR
jgi:hypothetical protein